MPPPQFLPPHCWYRGTRLELGIAAVLLEAALLVVLGDVWTGVVLVLVLDEEELAVVVAGTLVLVELLGMAVAPPPELVEEDEVVDSLLVVVEDVEPEPVLVTEA